MKRGNVFTALFMILLFGVQAYGGVSTPIPTGLDDTEATDHNITLTWNDVTGEIGYTIYAVEGFPGYETYTKVVGTKTLVADTTTYTVTRINIDELKSAKTYKFAITATYPNPRDPKNTIESDKSTSIKATTTHTWDGVLQECVNTALANSDPSHIPTRTELEDIDHFSCTDKYRDLTDISPVADLTAVERLYLYGNSITNIDALSGLSLLDYVRLDSNNISIITPLSGKAITGLDLAYNQITDFTPIASLTTLTYLRLTATGLSDLSILNTLNNLYELSIDENLIGDFSPLSTKTSLIKLYADACGLSDLSVLKDLTLLDDLDIGENDIKDISVLSGMESLNVLHMVDNTISDISALSELMLLDEVDLSYNCISDFSPVSHVTTVIGEDEQDMDKCKGKMNPALIIYLLD